MSDQQRPPRTALEALHFELLGTVLEIQTNIKDLQNTIPEAKKGAEGIASTLTEAFDALQSKAVSVVAYIKAKQSETMGEIDAASRKVTADSRKALGAMERLLLVSCALTGVNTLLLAGILFFRN